MNEKLIDTLSRLPSDPTVVVELYGQLFDARFWVLGQPTVNADAMQFLTYPTADEARELPAFTLDSRSVLADLSRQVPAAQIEEVEGPRFWSRILQLLESESFFVAVDPGEKHGIRLTREMILGMVGLHAAK
jgi:hypothetical protein